MEIIFCHFLYATNLTTVNNNINDDNNNNIIYVLVFVQEFIFLDNLVNQ